MQNNESEWLVGTRLAAMLGITPMTLWRWEQNEKLSFPKPTLINHRKYWHRDEINKWMRRYSSAKAIKAATDAVSNREGAT